ncbi:MBOAT family O-acyltransferase [Methylophaga sp.]|uniref:MBOAT family O-acyltransferase n=1 Tax=Methylophaga sp. TaxID=2024840 RepID=UPI003A941507
MLFNSYVFGGLFLPAILIIFWCMPSANAKRIVLILGSLIFYSYWLPQYLLLLIGLVAVAWWCARKLERSESAWPLWFACIILLGTLAYYKYSGFLLEVITDLGIAPDLFVVHQTVLPLGISFIVFQAMAYVIDVYRKDFPAENSFSTLLLFKGFFPQLIAGPICRAHELMPQLRGGYTFRLEQFTSGLAIFGLGLLLKEFFADGLAPLVDQLYSSETVYTFGLAWAASLGFGGQIYADFWGYSTMAVGLARMFSIDIPVNFRLPYIASSLREFWRRWHITLSQWLRDYLYKPLGGSRHGALRTLIALMVTMLLGGLWHGANYTFIVWGGIHGIALVIEHFISNRQLKISHQKRFSFINIIGWIYCFLVVYVTWVFFRANDLGQACDILSSMFSLTSMNGILNTPEVVRQILFLFALLMLMQFPIEWLLEKLRREKLSPWIAVSIAFWSVVGAVVLGAPATVPFIYFQF